jgi:hypothetical protein
MNKTNHKWLLVSAITLAGSFLFFGCSLTGGSPSSPANAGTGDTGGGAMISISNGVILLTPSQPFPTRDQTLIPGISTEVGTETPNPNITPSPAPTADTSSLNLPKGLTIYPGATRLDTSGLTNGMGGSKYIMFYTSSNPTQVITYYQQTLGQAGWTENPSATPGPTNGIGMWSSGTFFLQVIIKVDPQTGTLVTLSWLG